MSLGLLLVCSASWELLKSMPDQRRSLELEQDCEVSIRPYILFFIIVVKK
jgi:hypothetical protein